MIVYNDCLQRSWFTSDITGTCIACIVLLSLLVYSGFKWDEYKVLTCHPKLTTVLTGHCILPRVLTCHCILPTVLTCHPILPTVLTCHPILTTVLTCH